MKDFLIIGGGVIGMLTAWQLAEALQWAQHQGKPLAQVDDDCFYAREPHLADGLGRCGCRRWAVFATLAWGGARPMTTDWSNVQLASGANVDQGQSVLSWGSKEQGAESLALFLEPCVN